MAEKLLLIANYFIIADDELFYENGNFLDSVLKK